MEKHIADVSTVLPVACTLSEPELVERREDIAENVFSEVQQRIELEDGYEFLFPGTDEMAARACYELRTSRCTWRAAISMTGNGGVVHL